MDAEKIESIKSLFPDLDEYNLKMVIAFLFIVKLLLHFYVQMEIMLRGQLIFY
jgi:hypothetical protein